MQTARIPLAILIALEMAGAAGCTSVGPCLSPVAPPPADDDADGADDAYLGPCLNVAEDPVDPVMTPCLSPPPPDPHLGPCLEVAPPKDPDGPPKGPEIGPCLKVAPPEPPPPKEPRVGPCLRVAPPRDAPDRTPPKKPRAPDEDAGATARADVVEKLADTLPADVLAKLRDRDA